MCLAIVPYSNYLLKHRLSPSFWPTMGVSAAGAGGGDIAMKFAAKMAEKGNDIVKQQGQQAVQLIEGAAQAGRTQGASGHNLNVVA